ncbi:MAG: diiron oxygenase [Deltaproteobacteria bacterium]|nr:diiron oxygenase [Deltaproteobacteria bacterium]MBI3293767.1 diiron oxygenase [Deltaproteobacteria bacterium]
MNETEENRPDAKAPSFLLNDNPTLQELLLKPTTRDNAILNDQKIRRLYVQAASQQWFAPQRIDFTAPLGLTDEQRQVWIRLAGVFYTLEKMGLNVIMGMMGRAVRKFRSDELAYYLTEQAHDEGRHVFVIENYLKRLGAPPKFDRSLQILGQVTHTGFYQVENWLFSTLFSENFASSFLRRTRMATIDPIGAEMCKQLLVDESRHIHFLHIVLPDILDRLSLMGKTYLRASQGFMMHFTERVSRGLKDDAALVGIDRDALLEEVFENMEKSYHTLGLNPRFIPFAKIRNSSAIVH